jgi:hypothetical protein
MNWPLLPAMPDADELDAGADAALAPLAVLIDPFHDPRQPV